MREQKRRATKRKKNMKGFKRHVRTQKGIRKSTKKDTLKYPLGLKIANM